jgi:hypothetical protein|tara:strand:+ start:9262 stop:9567 length:306 start_codon:yes stop_codon:yes gene_type:complete
MYDDTKQKLRELIRSIYKELNEKEIEEITTTGAVDGYSTPCAFSNDEKKKKKKMKKALDSVGYKFVNEEIDRRDIKLLKLIIRDEVADIIRQIWIKRAVWQ